MSSWPSWFRSPTAVPLSGSRRSRNSRCCRYAGAAKFSGANGSIVLMRSERRVAGERGRDLREVDRAEKAVRGALAGRHRLEGGVRGVGAERVLERPVGGAARVHARGRELARHTKRLGRRRIYIGKPRRRV